jgi:adenylate cyclase class IV
MKENFEIRFFLDKRNAASLVRKWKKEKRKFQAYAFTDYYFVKAKSTAKIRKWKSFHKPSVEIIFVRRKKGFKKERNYPTKSIATATEKLNKLGYKKLSIIEKKRAWLISQKGKPTVALEFIPDFGWTGEIEFPKKDKKKISKYISNLKEYGAKDFSKKSLLELLLKRKNK